MKFFKRNSHPEPPSLSDPSTSVTDEPAEDLEQQEARSYQDIVDRLALIREQRDALVQDALSRGVSEAELPGLIADAMNAHQIPRVVQDPSVGRGGFVRLLLVDGSLTGSDLKVSTSREEDGSLRRSDVSFSVSPIALPDLGEPERSFTVGYSPNLPVIPNSGSVDPEMLAKIDTYMETGDLQQTSD